MLATSAVASAGPTPRMASSRLLVSFDVLSHDAAIKGQDLGFQCQQLSPKSSHAGPGYLGEPSVVGIGNNFEQLLDTIAPDRCDDPELGQLRTNGIDDRRLLANEQMPRPMKRQTALLLGGLGRHKPHVWSPYRFTNRFCVSCVVLMPFDKA
jgi:hypothetical protein